MKRSAWKLGCIVQLNTSEDGNIRSVVVRLGQRTKGLSIASGENREYVTRPLCMVYPLELYEEDPIIDQPVMDTTNLPPTNVAELPIQQPSSSAAAQPTVPFPSPQLSNESDSEADSIISIELDA